MPLTEPDLWNLIKTWPLPHRYDRDTGVSPPRVCTCFEHNLRRLGDWTDESSIRIAETYRAFLYLKALTGETLCPPRWIDQAWHLHLEFPQDYAALEAKLGRRIEHRRDLSPDETLQSYQRGRSLWAREFGNAPPSDLWPVSKLGRENRIRYAVMLAFWCAALAVFALALTVGLSPVWAVLIGVGFMGGCLYYLDFWLIPVPSSPDTVDRSSCG